MPAAAAVMEEDPEMHELLRLYRVVIDRREARERERREREFIAAVRPAGAPAPAAPAAGPDAPAANNNEEEGRRGENEAAAAAAAVEAAKLLLEAKNAALRKATGVLAAVLGGTL
jgi:hypothetical protein